MEGWNKVLSKLPPAMSQSQRHRQWRASVLLRLCGRGEVSLCASRAEYRQCDQGPIQRMPLCALDGSQRLNEAPAFGGHGQQDRASFFR